MLVKGVRSSCDMAARNSLLAWLAMLALASLRVRASWLRVSRRMLRMNASTKSTTAALSTRVNCSTVSRMALHEANACALEGPHSTARS